MEELIRLAQEELIAEAIKRAESKRPKLYIGVKPTEADPIIEEAQTEVDKLTSLIPEDIRETFRVEINPNPLTTDPYVIKKKEQPHTLVLPKSRLKVNPGGIIITGIMNHYLNQSIIPNTQMNTLLDILTGQEVSEALEVTKVKKKRVKKEGTERVKREKAPVVKSDIQNTAGTDIIKLATICDELGIDPKKARIKLRKHFNKPANGWEWSADKVDEIKAFLK